MRHHLRPLIASQQISATNSSNRGKNLSKRKQGRIPYSRHRANKTGLETREPKSVIDNWKELNPNAEEIRSCKKKIIAPMNRNLRKTVGLVRRQLHIGMVYIVIWKSDLHGHFKENDALASPDRARASELENVRYSDHRTRCCNRFSPPKFLLMGISS